MSMTNDELREYATWLIEDHAQDVEYISVHEMWETYSEDGSEIGEDDALKVHDLIRRDAEVTVTWPTDD